MVLIDTSVWICALRKSPHPAITERISSLLLESDVAVNGLILVELLSGARTAQEFERLQSRLESLNYVEITRPVWQVAADLGFRLRRAGITVPNTDVIICATALSTRAFLVHADAHFDLVAEHSELQVESYAGLV